MGTTWVLEAHRTGARLFRSTGDALIRIQEFDQPEGRVRDQDIEAPEPKRTFDRHAEGRYAHDRGRSPQDQVAAGFMHELADVLYDHRVRDGEARFVLVAEPRILGTLRAELDDVTRERVLHTVPKDLGRVRDDEMRKHLSDYL